MSIRVDVLVPAFNAQSTIEESLASIQSQTLREISIIIVDDGSTDSTSRKLAKIGSYDPRIRIIKRPNGGIVDALNLGLKYCTAEFVARHDADDIAFPDRLERQLAYLQRDPDCVAVGAFARHIDASGRPTGTLAKFPPPSQADYTQYPSAEPYLLHPFLMARRGSLTAVGGYRHVLHAEDTDLYWRLKRLGRLENVEDVLGSYRFSPQSLTSSSVLNGRAAALYSQLAALSAARVDRRRDDLDFTKPLQVKVTAARTAEGMERVISPMLTEDELGYLRPAFAAKMLEVTSYRPYELDATDCRYIREALRNVDARLSGADRKRVVRLQAVTIARLLRHGRLREALILIEGRNLAQAVLRVAVQSVGAALPRRLRAKIPGASE